MKYSNRNKKFTHKEYKALDRYPNGDVKDLADAFLWMKQAQKDRLTGDDQSRLFEYEEELEYLMADLEEEFANEQSK